MSGESREGTSSLGAVISNWGTLKIKYLRLEINGRHASRAMKKKLKILHGG